MAKKNRDGLLVKYETERDTYSSFAQTVSNLLARLLSTEGIEVHSVDHRCKTVKSLRGKIDKKGGYEYLEEITDLAGIRLITHYEDDVDRVANVIESEFVVDRENSIDKRTSLDPDRFGYLSLHYVVSLAPDRLNLREYRSFSNMKAEIQIRSILQHAWAEIEHDTGYKTEVEVPKHIRRRFSRLAGLLELADLEFIGIRKALLEYSEAVTIQVETALESTAEKIDTLIDGVSLVKFLELEPLVTELDNEICSILKAEKSTNTRHALADIVRLNALEIHNLSELKSALSENKDLIILRAKEIAKKGGLTKSKEKDFVEVRYGVCILYLIQVTIAKIGNKEGIRTKLKELDFKNVDNLTESLSSLLP